MLIIRFVFFLIKIKFLKNLILFEIINLIFIFLNLFIIIHFFQNLQNLSNLLLFSIFLILIYFKIPCPYFTHFFNTKILFIIYIYHHQILLHLCLKINFINHPFLFYAKFIHVLVSFYNQILISFLFIIFLLIFFIIVP